MTALLLILAACPIERGAVKTLADGAELHGQVLTATIEALVSMPRPAMVTEERSHEEFQQYRVKARVLGYRLEADGDYHLLISGASGATMIAEVGDPACATGDAKAALTKARRRFLRYFAAPSTRFQRFRSRPWFWLTGPFSWDTLHGQRGAAKNGAELHPILEIEPVRP